VLFDTGLLLRVSTPRLDHSKLCLSLWQSVKKGELRACIAQQTVWEFYSVLTRLDVPHREVVAEIQKHLLVFPVILTRPETFPNCLGSLQRLRWLKGSQLYDLVLAQTALDNGIEEVYTFNDRHFRRFGLPLTITNPATS
jgi:predicted nucleic acid-binding protein